MEACDRQLFTTEATPYDNKPLNIGNHEVMTSPSTHALTLEILYQFIHPSCRILDVGCGTGYLSQCFARLNPTGKVLGIDFHRDLITKAKKIHGLSNLEFRHCDAFEVIEDEFDIINVGFAANEELFKNMREKADKGALLCPINNNWVLCVNKEKHFLGEVGFSLMRAYENTQEKLEEIDCKIKEIYNQTEKILGRKPNINDLPKEIHEILKERRRIQAKIKKETPKEENHL